MGSTPRASSRAPFRDAHSSFLDSSRSREGPFAGDRWSIDDHRRGFVTRSTLHARGPCEPSLPCESDVPTIEDACDRLLLIHGFGNGHPSYRVATAPLCDAASCDASTNGTGADGVSRHRARFGGSTIASRAGVVFPSASERAPPPDAPVAEPSASRRDFRARASSSAEIDSRPHIVKRAGLLDPRRLPPTAGRPPCTGALASLWQDGSVAADATATTIRGRTHALS